MRFRIEQRFRVGVADVGRALISVNYLTTAMAELPDIGRPEVRNHRVVGDTTHLALEYQFGGSLPSVARRVIDPAKLTWIEETTIDASQWTAAFTMTPTHYASFFRCRGTWQLVERAGQTIRVIEGELKVNSPVPFVGGQVEKAIVSGLRERLALEPPLLERWVADTA